MVSFVGLLQNLTGNERAAEVAVGVLVAWVVVQVVMWLVAGGFHTIMHLGQSDSMYGDKNPNTQGPANIRNAVQNDGANYGPTLTGGNSAYQALANAYPPAGGKDNFLSGSGAPESLAWAPVGVGADEDRAEQFSGGRLSGDNLPDSFL